MARPRWRATGRRPDGRGVVAITPKEAAMDPKVIELLERLGPDTLEEIARRLREAKAPARGAHVTVRFVETTALGAGAAKAPARAADEFGARAFASLTPELRAAMRAHEPKLLAWLRASPANCAAFAMDPIASIAKALPDFDPKLLDQIREIRRRRARTRTAVPGMPIASLRFEAHPRSK
jgi:hypothetical protein